MRIIVSLWLMSLVVVGTGQAQSLSERVEAARGESNQAVVSQFPDAAQQWQAREERALDREAMLDVARIQAWGMYMQSRPFQHPPATNWQPSLPLQSLWLPRQRTCVTQGGGSWMTVCE